MAYNYFYPNYQNYQNQNPGRIWVQGIEAARAYLVAPGASVDLWDSEQQTIYLKSADASGLPSMRVLDYTIRDAQPPQNTPLTQKTDIPTREEFNALKAQIEALKKEIERSGVDESTLSELAK